MLPEQVLNSSGQVILLQLLSEGNQCNADYRRCYFRPIPFRIQRMFLKMSVSCGHICPLYGFHFML